MPLYTGCYESRSTLNENVNPPAIIIPGNCIFYSLENYLHAYEIHLIYRLIESYIILYIHSILPTLLKLFQIARSMSLISSNLQHFVMNIKITMKKMNTIKQTVR